MSYFDLYMGQKHISVAALQDILIILVINKTAILVEQSPKKSIQ